MLLKRIIAYMKGRWYAYILHPLRSLSSFFTEGKRTVRMDETFFTGYRRTILKPEEILLSVEIPFSRKVRSMVKSPVLQIHTVSRLCSPHEDPVS